MADAVTAARLTGRLTLSPVHLAVAFVAAAGIALRVATYRSALGIPNSDEAVMGLMARHALHGEFTTFLWGTAYGGPQEAWLTAPVFAVTGSSMLGLRLVPVLLDVLTVVLVWRVGRRMFGERPAAVAAALYWIWPPDALYLHVHQTGFYASNDLYCVLILLLALLIRERTTAARVGLLGLVLGLAFWQTSQIVPIEIAALGWLAWRQPRVLRHAWAGAGLALVGALPWIVWNVGHHWGSLHLRGGTDASYLWRLRTFASPLLPEALGLRAPGSVAWVLPFGLAAAAYVALAVLFVYGAYRNRGRDASLLYVVAATVPFMTALSPKTFLSTDPRYSSILMPVFALLAAQLGTTYRRAGVVLLAAALLTTLTLREMDRQLRETLRVNAPAPRDIGPLLSTLDRLHVRHAYADYWIAYRIDLDGRERIVAVENKFERLVPRGRGLVPTPDPFVRYRPFDRLVRRDPRAAFVLFQGMPGRARILAQLRRAGYTRHAVQDLAVYVPPAAPG